MARQHLRVLDPDPGQAEAARRLADVLEGDVEAGSREVPEELRGLLAPLLRLLARGPLAVAPRGRELTTGEAAELLNCSRPHVVKLVDEGALPHRRVGTHRRIPLEAVLEHREATSRERRRVLDELLEATQGSHVRAAEAG